MSHWKARACTSVLRSKKTGNAFETGDDDNQSGRYFLESDLEAINFQIETSKLKFSLAIGIEDQN